MLVGNVGSLLERDAPTSIFLNASETVYKQVIAELIPSKGQLEAGIHQVEPSTGIAM